MRASMSSASGCENVSNVRTAGPPGFTNGARDLEGPPAGSSPKNIRSTVMCAASRQLCPETHSGYGAVMSAVQAGVGHRRGVAVLRRSWDRVPRPPEVEVVLVVPAVDRRVRPAQVLQREEPRAVGGVEAVPCDELPGDLVPAQNGCALPPLGDVRLLGRSGSSRSLLPRLLTSLNSSAHCGLSSAGGGAERNCEELWMRNGLTSPTHGVGSRIGWRRVRW